MMAVAKKTEKEVNWTLLLIAFSSSLISAIPATVAALAAYQAKEQAEETHKEVNSRTDKTMAALLVEQEKLIEAVKKAAKAEAVKENHNKDSVN